MHLNVEPDANILELMLAIIFFLVAVIYMILICCGMRQLTIAVAFMDATADFIRKTKRVICVPVTFFFIAIVGTVIWGLCMLSLNSIGEIVPDPDRGPQFKRVTTSPDQKATIEMMNTIMIFGIIWIWSFISDMTGFIAMFTACTYYFNSTHKK